LSTSSGGNGCGVLPKNQKIPHLARRQ